MCTEKINPLDHEGLLVDICKRFRWAIGDNITFEDLRQESRLAALQCAESYDSCKGTWPSFADTCVHRRLMAYCLAQRSTVHVPHRVARRHHENGEAGLSKVQPQGLDAGIEDYTSTCSEISRYTPAAAESALDTAISNERRSLTHELLTVLDSTERTVITRCIFDGASQQEVADEMGCSRPLVSKIQLRAISKMQAEAARLGRDP